MTAQIPEGSIIITPTEVYNEVKSLTDVVRQLVAENKADTIPQQVADLQTRVRALEAKVWIASGFAAALGGGLGGIIPALLK